MATIHELHTKLVNKEISAVELTKAVIAHKEQVEPAVHAYLSDSHEQALAVAANVDEKIAKTAIRIGVGRFTTKSDVEYIAAQVLKALS